MLASHSFASSSSVAVTLCVVCMQDVIQALHLHVDSLKNQVGSLLDEAEDKDRLVNAINQQLDLRDRHIRDLTKQLHDAERQLADVTTALKAGSGLLKEREQELADKEAELASLRSGSARQPAQQQLQQKLQRVGSVASTSHR